MAKTKALISFAVTAKLICVFVFAFAKSRFSHDEAQLPHLISSNRHCSLQSTNVDNRRIKHDFPFINIRNVTWGLLQTKGGAGCFKPFPRDIANVDKIMFNHCINSTNHSKRRKCWNIYAFIKMFGWGLWPNSLNLARTFRGLRYCTNFTKVMYQQRVNIISNTCVVCPLKQGQLWVKYEGDSIYNEIALITLPTHGLELHTLYGIKEQGFTFRMVHITSFYHSYLSNYRL